MQAVRDFNSITSHLAIWHTYDVALKAELYSTCLATVAGIYLIDPILLQKRALDSLRKLLHYKAERILFAHGTPILSNASERFRGLLNSDL